MSVIVKGMEMPTTCCNCKFRERTYVLWEIEREADIPQ